MGRSHGGSGSSAACLDFSKTEYPYGNIKLSFNLDGAEKRDRTKFLGDVSLNGQKLNLVATETTTLAKRRAECWPHK